jgi:hypothetical protein
VDDTVGYLADLYRRWGKTEKAAMYVGMLHERR